MQTTPSAGAWRNILCWTALCSAAAPMLSAQTVLSETFVAGQRLTQDLPNTSAWHGSNNGTETVLFEITGGIRLDYPTATQHLYTYFTDSGVVSISPGEMLQVTYQFQVVAPKRANTSIRVGLLNSGGSRNTNEASGTSISAYAAYTGYGAFFSPIMEAAPAEGDPDTHSIRQRTGTDNGLLHVGTPWTTLSSITDDLTLAEGTLYTGIFSVNHTGASLLISHQILSGATMLSEVSHTTTSALVTGFDTFAIAGLGGETRTDAIELYAVDIAVVPVPIIGTLIQAVLEKSTDQQNWEPAEPGSYDTTDEPLYFRPVVTPF